MRRRARPYAILVVIGLLFGIGSASPAQAGVTTISATGWSKAAKHAGPAYAPEGQVLVNVRGVGINIVKGPDFDRLVFVTKRPKADGKAGAIGFHAQYVAEVLAQGSGEPLTLKGKYKLEVNLGVPAHDENYVPTYPGTYDQPLVTVAKDGKIVPVTAGKRIKHTVWGATYEGITQVGLGLNKKCPFRVLVLRASKQEVRVAVDVKHC